MNRISIATLATALGPALGFLGLLAVLGVIPPWSALGAAALVAAGGAGVRSWAEGSRPVPPADNDPDGGARRDSTVLQSLPEPVILLDWRRRVVLANPAAESLFGARPGADLSLALRHPDALAAVDAVLAGDARRAVEIELPVPVAQTYLLHVVRLVDAQGATPPGAVLTLHDLTLAKRAEQMRADFVANVSHELRTPLTSLLGFIETLQHSARDDAEARERFLEIMRIEANRMAAIIEDLLSLSRVEAEEHVRPAAAVNVCGLLGHVAAVLAVRAQERDMRIDIACPDNTPLVQGDEPQLHQVFQNLLDNALKYGRPGTTVEVTVRPLPRLVEADGPGVEVAVRDHGEGIPASELPRLTERFYRVDKARSRRMGGTGLGLAIVKHIVSRHRGRLVIDSTEGEGSVFTVLLPAAPTPGQES